MKYTLIAFAILALTLGASAIFVWNIFSTTVLYAYLSGLGVGFLSGVSLLAVIVAENPA